MKRSRIMELQNRAAELVQKVLPFIRPEQLEIAWFGLEDESGLLGLVNLFNEERFCGKLLVSRPGWVCPEHHHLSTKGHKDEGFVVLFGELIVIEPGGKKSIAHAGETIYMPAGTVHSLASGKEGAVYIEFSERDNRIDIFTRPDIIRDPQIVEDVPGFVPMSNGFPILGDHGIRLSPHIDSKG